MRALTDLRRALDASSIVAITDPEGIITYVNDKFCEISGFSRDELVGNDHRCVNSNYHSKEMMAELWNTIRSGQIWRGDLRNRAKDGTVYWVSTTIVPFVDESGVPYQYLSIRNDITERKRAEQDREMMVRRLAELTDRERRRAEELRLAHDQLVEANKRILEERSKVIQAEKLSSIGMLAAGVAHEINNPLSGVMGCVRALESGSLSEQRRHDYFRATHDGLERIRTTVQGLLDYARDRKPQFGEHDLAGIVESSLRLLHVVMAKRDVTVEQHIQPDTLTVRGDSAQLMQAVVNVVMNAIHASPANGIIAVKAEQVDSTVSLSITDQGPGIPPEHLSRICDPFFTTKTDGEGTGLGLSVTLAIIESHRGELLFEAGEDRGTTVVLRLPATIGAAP